MSAARSLFRLAVFALVLLAANFFIEFGANAPRRLPRSTLADIPFVPSRISLERASSPAVVLENDGAWRLVRPFAARSDSQKVLRLVDALSFSVPEETVSEGELLRMGRERADLGLEEPRLRVTLENASALSSVTVSFGDYTPSSKGVYAAVEGSDIVCVVPSRVYEAVDLAAADFRSREVFPVAEESVHSFSVKIPSRAPIEFTRDAGGWKTEDGPTSLSKVKMYLANLSEAEALSFVWPVGASNEAASVSSSLLSGYGLDPETALTVVSRGYDGENRRVSFGSPVDDSSVYALVQNGGAIVTVHSSVRDTALHPPVRSASSRVFPFEESAVTAFTLSCDSVSYVLARRNDGTWGLESPVVAPADANTVATLLARILALPVSDGAAVKDGVSVSVGTNSSPVVVSKARLFGSLKIESLRSKEVVSIDPAVVTRLVSTAGGTSVSLAYSRERETWVPEGEGVSSQVDLAQVKKVLSAVKSLNALKVESLKASPAELAGYGLESPRHVLAVDRGGDGSVRCNILIGNGVKGGYYATVGSADAIFVIPAATAKIIMSPLIR